MTYLAQNTRLISYDPEEMIINVIENGDSFNEVPVIDTKIWLIDAGALRTVIAKHPEAAQ